MPFTRKHGVLRILIGCVDQTNIAKSLPVLIIKGVFYKLTFEVEEPNFDLGDEVHMTDFDANIDDDPKDGSQTDKAHDQPGSILEKAASPEWCCTC